MVAGRGKYCYELLSEKKFLQALLLEIHQGFLPKKTLLSTCSRCSSLFVKALEASEVEQVIE
jgi:hypothetical protein